MTPLGLTLYSVLLLLTVALPAWRILRSDRSAGVAKANWVLACLFSFYVPGVLLWACLTSMAAQGHLNLALITGYTALVLDLAAKAMGLFFPSLVRIFYELSHDDVRI